MMSGDEFYDDEVTSGPIDPYPTRLVPRLNAPLVELVVEDHESYVVTVDMEDEPPQHNHFDIWDAPEDCPRCEWDVKRAEG